MPIINMNDYEINYEIKGNGPHLILLHDGFFGIKTWDKVYDLLSAHFTVVAYDRRGYGRSTHIDNFTGDIIESGVDELKSFTEALGIQTFHLCGHCLGAAIAVQFTHQYPDMVHKLIIEAGGLYTDEYSEDKCDWTFKPFEDLETEFRDQLNEMHGLGYAQKLWDIMRAYKDSYIMYRYYTIMPSIKMMKNEMFFIYGDRDFYFNIAHAIAGFVLKRRRSKLWIVPNTGHIPHMERSIDFAKMVIEYLN